jgi:transposase-like protein
VVFAIQAELSRRRGIDRRTRSQGRYLTVNRWVIKYAPLLAAVARRLKRAVGLSWRLDETYIKVAGGWKYYYRAVDKEATQSIFC